MKGLTSEKNSEIACTILSGARRSVEMTSRRHEAGFEFRPPLCVRARTDIRTCVPRITLCTAVHAANRRICPVNRDDDFFSPPPSEALCAICGVSAGASIAADSGAGYRPWILERLSVGDRIFFFFDLHRVKRPPCVYMRHPHGASARNALIRYADGHVCIKLRRVCLWWRIRKWWRAVGITREGGPFLFFFTSGWLYDCRGVQVDSNGSHMILHSNL